MTRILSGFGGLRTKQEEESAKRLSGDFIQYMRLADDGDIVRFRIVSEHEEERCAESGLPSYLISAMFHRHKALSSKGREYFTATLCGMEEDEAGELYGECRLCDEEVARSLQFMVWAWVYAVFHKKQNADVKNQWARGKLGEMVMYKEPINKFMVWQDGFFSSQMLEGRIQRYGTLTDRDYERTRRGARGQTQVKYELDSLDPTELSPEVRRQLPGLPDLMDIATGKVRTMSGDAAKEKPRAEASQGEAPPAKEYREVPVDGDDEDDLPF